MQNKYATSTKRQQVQQLILIWRTYRDMVINLMGKTACENGEAPDCRCSWCELDRLRRRADAKVRALVNQRNAMR